VTRAVAALSYLGFGILTALLVVACLVAVLNPLPITEYRSVERDIVESRDLAWLENVAMSPPDWRGRRAFGKGARITAYARLGELATPESLRAQKRVAAAERARPMMLPEHMPLFVNWPYPGPRVSDEAPDVLAETRTDDGQRIVIATSQLLGPPHLFVIRCDPMGDIACTRPLPVSEKSVGYRTMDAALAIIGAGHFRVRLQPHAYQNPFDPLSAPPPTPPAQTLDFVLADVERDSDGDRRTDIEERVLGLDPMRADSDGDGISDGQDRSPEYAPPSSDAQDEDAVILQQAVFAVFGLSDSPLTLFALHDHVRRLQLSGLPAPVLYNRRLAYQKYYSWIPAYYVSWTIVTKTTSEAVVEIEYPRECFYENRHLQVSLRRVHQEWVVVGAWVDIYGDRLFIDEAWLARPMA
jgi:hypothetical protein